MQKIIRIGTRESKLALWQANKVRAELAELGYESVLVGCYRNFYQKFRHRDA